MGVPVVGGCGRLQRASAAPAASTTFGRRSTRTAAAGQSSSVGFEDADTAEGIDLPGADLSGGELLIQVIPPQRDRSTCASGFLVRRSGQVRRPARRTTIRRVRGAAGAGASGAPRPPRGAGGS
nr:DUF4193 family protein [Arthrobacter ruber]